MSILLPFKGIRPVKDKARLVASRPYDVLNPQEAAHEATGNPYSFYHVVKPEIDVAPTEDFQTRKVYEKGRDNFLAMVQEGLFFQDPAPCLYVYRLTMQGHAQTGIVGCASVMDYKNGIIKKHEQIRPDKVEDRKQHLSITRLHAEPVFYAYKTVAAIDSIVSHITNREPEYDFITEDSIGHTFWVIDNAAMIAELVQLFAAIDFTYIADGHHRTAAAAAYYEDNSEGSSHCALFPVALFPDSHLQIMDYNRLVKDLNGLNNASFLTAIATHFDVEPMGSKAFKPQRPYQFSMYLENAWYKLDAKPHTISSSNAVNALDVSILTEYLLKPILNIADQQNDRRIDFVGGMRGLEVLEKQVNTGNMAVAFALFPATMEQLFTVADAGLLMPPKSTWFEPKLRSGLVIHGLDNFNTITNSL